MISLELRGIVVNNCTAFQLDLQIEFSLKVDKVYSNINYFYRFFKVFCRINVTRGQGAGRQGMYMPPLTCRVSPVM